MLKHRGASLKNGSNGRLLLLQHASDIQFLNCCTLEPCISVRITDLFERAARTIPTFVGAKHTSPDFWDGAQAARVDNCKYDVIIGAETVIKSNTVSKYVACSPLFVLTVHAASKCKQLARVYCNSDKSL